MKVCDRAVGPTTNIKEQFVSSTQTLHFKLFFVFFPKSFCLFPKKFFVFSENSKKFTIETSNFQLKLTNQTDPKKRTNIGILGTQWTVTAGAPDHLSWLPTWQNEGV